MTKALAGLFAAGATLALITVALPHSAHASDVGLLTIVGIAYIVAGVLFWRADTVPGWILRVALALGSTLITGVAYFSAQSPSPLVFFYLWVFLYSALLLQQQGDGGPDRLRRARVRRSAGRAGRRPAGSPRGGWSAWARCSSPRS